ncbi:MAG: hypothetical protein QME40_02965 [bacterium]|nr:hypothetical protein [bacterium]
MKKALKIILGVGLIVFGLVLAILWWKSLLVIIKGCIGIVLILAGIICFMI